MSYRIRNRSDGPILARLRSGRTLHLASGEYSPPVAGAEVIGNSRLEPLRARHLIEIVQVTAESAEPVSVGRPAPASRRAGGRRLGSGRSGAARSDAPADDSTHAAKEPGS